MRAELITYYHQAYAAIREHSDTVVVIFCVLYWFDYWAWVRELREPAHFNVALDMHRTLALALTLAPTLTLASTLAPTLALTWRACPAHWTSLRWRGRAWARWARQGYA